MNRPLSAVAAVALVVAGLSIGSPPRADAMDFGSPTGTRAVGNSYVILWVEPDPNLTVRSVKIGGRWAIDRKGFWEVVLLGEQRNRVTRKVEVHAKQGIQRTRVSFEEVPW